VKKGKGTTMDSPIKVFNGINDITDKDVARQRYYQLSSEQSWWNIQRRIDQNKKQQEDAAIKRAVGILLVISLLGLAFFIATAH